jgi:hypothetical protein
MRFRFTIRDLLWLTALVALGLGWWVDRSQLRSRLTVAEDANYLENESHLSSYVPTIIPTPKSPNR